MHCILIFIQYYHMFRLSTSASIRQDTGSKDIKQDKPLLENSRYKIIVKFISIIMETE